MSTTYTDVQLDALREVANIGSGTAATALSSLIGLPVDLDVPSALALPLAEAVELAGPGELEVTAVAIPIVGDVQAVVLIVMQPETVAVICELLGVEPGTEMGLSALGEVGNILGASYVGALSSMTGLALEPTPPQAVTDMLGAILASALLADGDRDAALLLESKLTVTGRACSPAFMFIPAVSGTAPILASLGLAA